jgi:hypothetical protein
MDVTMANPIMWMLMKANFKDYMCIECYLLWTFFVIENNGFLQSPYHELKEKCILF